MESRYRILSDNHILSCTPGTSMLYSPLGKFFRECLFATRPHILLLAVVRVSIIQVFCSSHRFRLAHITAFLYKFSYGLHNRVSHNALYVVHLWNLWKDVVELHKLPRIAQCLCNNSISLFPNFFSQIRVLLVIRDCIIKRQIYDTF